MTVQELASKMNELMREGFRDYDVRIAIMNTIRYPILDIVLPVASNNTDKSITLSAVMPKVASVSEKTALLITDVDLERAQRATYDPKE